MPKINYQLLWEAPLLNFSNERFLLKSKYDLFINGEFRTPQNKKYYKKINPKINSNNNSINEKVITEIGYADESDLDLAVSSAKTAYNEVWSKISGINRGKYLYRIVKLIEANKEELIFLESLDTGKSEFQIRQNDFPLILEIFYYYAGWSDKLEYSFFNQKVNSIGVIAEILHFNSPFLLLSYKLAPALACGNTVIIKTDQNAPLATLKVSELILQAQLPKGVFNLITGSNYLNEFIIKNDDIDKVVFTGSSEHGSELQKINSIKRKKLSMDLNAKGAIVIFEDANIDNALDAVVSGVFLNQGLFCSAGTTLFINENVSNEVIVKLKEKLSNLNFSNNTNENSQVSNTLSKKHLEKLENILIEATKEGAKMYQSENILATPNSSYFLPPTLLFDLNENSKILFEETLGPILIIQTFANKDDLIYKLNRPPYGYGIGLWSQNNLLIYELALSLKAGIIWLNSFNNFNTDEHFGGYRESYIGGSGGVLGLKTFLGKH